MRRLFPLLMIVLAFTSVACPPTPKVVPIKPDDGAKVDDKKTPIEVPTDLKPRIEAAIEQVQSRELVIGTHYFWTIFHGILGSGLEKTTLTYPDKKKVNAIEFICDGGDIPGMQFLPRAHGLDVKTSDPRDPTVQGVEQGHQDQFIAEMAQWGMPIDKKFKVGGAAFTFEDFTRQSKMKASTTKMQELSWAIIIVAQYYGTDHKWTNEFKENLSFDDIVRYELNAPIDQSACGGTHRLFGLTWAYHLHLKNGGKKTVLWTDVETKINDYKNLAKKMQNPDGSFSTEYFRTSGNDRKDWDKRIGTTGHTVEWLALAMTDEELKSDWMQSAVSALSLMILDRSRAEIDSGALYHAAHGLHLYHSRVFGTPAPYLALPPKR